MFSKILAFGLGALALVNAAPADFSFQTPMLSCSVNMLGTSQAAVKSFDSFPPGKYKIFNKAFPDSQIVAHPWDEEVTLSTPGKPVTLSPPGLDPGPVGVWRIRYLLGEHKPYEISNIGTHEPTYCTEYLIRTGGLISPFNILPVGGQEYMIQPTELEDSVWSLGIDETVHLEPQQRGDPRQLWRFEAVN
ncbi:hypothetical protein K438DRAFT_1941965 [Mycena galopus ATCC 62051]|nr:hypothetical protein K438DRAFT_1941965 [Mycena galopus ATCC 62051]